MRAKIGAGLPAMPALYTNGWYDVRGKLYGRSGRQPDDGSRLYTTRRRHYAGINHLE